MTNYDFPRAKPIAYTASDFGQWLAWPPENDARPNSILYDTGGVLNRTVGPGVLLGGQTVTSVLEFIARRDAA